MRALTPCWDGDTPTYRFPFVAGGLPKDTSTFAIEFYLYDEGTGALIGVRPGIAVSPRSGGKYDLVMEAPDTDEDGAGRVLIVKPVAYVPIQEDGTPATNVLANLSFETDTNADGIPDEWSIGGNGSVASALLTTAPAPNAIWGKCVKLSQISNGSTPRFFCDDTTVGPGPGTLVSAGMWVRTYRITGPAGLDHSLCLSIGGSGTPVDFAFTPLAIGTSKWRFVTVSNRVMHTQTGQMELQIRMSYALFGWSGYLELDDPFLFHGQWARFPLEARRVDVRGRPTIVKTVGNLIAGYGSFEQDSDGDGLADGLINLASNCTFSLDREPDNVADGLSSQRIVMAQSTAKKIRIGLRGRFGNGETWHAGLKVRTSRVETACTTNGTTAVVKAGAFYPYDVGRQITGTGVTPTTTILAYVSRDQVTASQAIAAGTPDLTIGNLVGTGNGFGMQIDTEELDGTGAAQLGANVSFGTALTAFTETIASLTLAQDVGILYVTINLNNVTGTAWLDGLRIWKS